MSDLNLSDEKRQEDEIKVIESIYESAEFTYKINRGMECSFNAFVTIIEKPLKVQCVEADPLDTSGSRRSDILIEYLPPVRVFTKLPYRYPSEEPPEFYLVISWLPQWQTSFVCQKLDEIWMANKGNEVLFLWFNFLKFDLLNFLNITNILDVSFLYTVCTNPIDYIHSDFVTLYDPRAVNRSLFLNPLQFLMNFDKDQRKIEFEKKIFHCNICLELHAGRNCIELLECNHIHCRRCMQQYISEKINSNSVKSIVCPSTGCLNEITEKEVRDLCPQQFLRYMDLLLEVALNTMNDIVRCPRKICQFPVLKDSDDTLAVCANCGYCFCHYCGKVYHGVSPCAMSSDITKKLIRDYQNSDFHGKKLLEKKYGRRQIQIIAEKYLTAQYLKDNAKSCPSCQTFTTKVDGCNKMFCTYCKASFCWLCGTHITLQNAYDHFLQRDGKCFGRLLEGILDVDPDL